MRASWREVAVPTVLFAGILCLVPGCPGDTAATRPPPVARDPAAGLDAGASYMRAAFLAMSGRDHDALPYFRHSLALRGDAWQVHYDFALSLINVAFETAPGRGLPHPATRSSLDRVALVREALAHLDLANRFAPRPSDRAMVERVQGEQLATWGFDWDALGYLDRAVTDDPDHRRGDLDRLVFEMVSNAGAPRH